VGGHPVGGHPIGCTNMQALSSLPAILGIQSTEESAMERIVVYTDTLNVETIAPALGDHEIVRAASTVELARAIVGRSRVIALIIEKAQIDESFLHLLSSIKKSFPILQICLITDSEIERDSADPATVDCSIASGGDRLVEELKTFVSNIDVTERRDHPRFDWPLQGSLSVDEKSWNTHNLWALSADGAFLESPTYAPTHGERAILKISFQNSRMVTECEVLDRRPPSLRLPAGFAVRFTQLSEDSMRLIDRIIQDALVQTLLEPDSEPEIPTLGEQDLSIPDFESF
jgi:hypothetical protein